ncbi:hypothetical protein [Mesorhizobium sp.]|uniref:hypothetical protein n=1 Tax=Mesorhizobium sp. TaxID=1871066 RepID=UPI000FE4C7DC|nr:hypothetical protein [Mesorhizobium sp.]RWM16149.1 MAG: hypothetical protein EOR74_34100 [Mesorhizobium sp.]RWM28341.1 MAG: hypothetical protein EOR75_33200 [Mesorhizobium sp.]TIO72347.1 MAG: hypothetical protein E5X75_33010 [Mesorhizobium sp.]TIO81180.1 MAG: hypothetical protein E5X74_29825 [Mesorhizobium sp.]TJV47422.1 MAG: hypothetical protein E5Y01_32920 [Mesorhizobium sp.]
MLVLDLRVGQHRADGEADGGPARGWSSINCCAERPAFVAMSAVAAAEFVSVCAVPLAMSDTVPAAPLAAPGFWRPKD